METWAEFPLWLKAYVIGIVALSLVCVCLEGIREWREYLRGQLPGAAPKASLPRVQAGWLELLFLGWATLAFAYLLQFAFLLMAQPLEIWDADWPLALAALAFPAGLYGFCRLIVARHPAGTPFREPQRTLGKAIAPALYQLLVAVPLLWLTAWFWAEALALVDAVFGGVDTRPQDAVTLIADQRLSVARAVLFVAVVVLAPLGEEYFFRGLLYRFFKGVVPRIWALVLSALLFALLHFNTFSFLSLFLLGLLLGRAYERTGDLRVPVLMHAFFNLNNFVLLSLLGPQML